MIVRELIAVLGIDLDDRDVKKVDNAVSSFEGKLQKVGQFVGGSIFVAGLARASVAVVEMASNAEETLNVVRESFGANAADVEAWSTKVAKEVGRSEFLMREMAGTLGAILTPMMEGNTQASSEMSTKLAALAVDLASFFNTSESEALEKLKSGLVGSTEPLLAFGVNLQVANLQAFALSKGISKSVTKMSQAEKAALRYELILRDTAQAQGDAARTADGYANASRAAADGMKDLATRIGSRLLPVASRFMAWARDAARGLSEVMQKTNLVESALVVLAGALGVVGVMLLAPFAPFLLVAAKVALALGAITLVGDELITLFKGGKTVIGEFIDKMFGVGTTQIVIDSIKGGWEDLKVAIGEAGDGVGEFADAFMSDMEVMGKAFGSFSDDFKSDMAAMGDAFKSFWEDVTARSPDFSADMGAMGKSFSALGDVISSDLSKMGADLGKATGLGGFVSDVREALSSESSERLRSQRIHVGDGLSVTARQGSTGRDLRAARARELVAKRRLTKRERSTLTSLESTDADKLNDRQKKQLADLRTKRETGPRLRQEQLTKRERLELSRITDPVATAPAAMRERQRATVSAAPMATSQVVNAPINANINITEASNPEAVRRAVQRGISDAVADAGAATARGVR